MGKTMADVLLYARDLIAQGFIKGQLADVSSNDPLDSQARAWCVRGAIMAGLELGVRALGVRAGTGNTQINEVELVVERLLGLPTGESQYYSALVEWNNRPDTTQQMVIDALDDAAKEAKERGL